MSVKPPVGLVRIEPLPVDGHKMLVNRSGGNKDLPVIESEEFPGVFTSAWMINKNAKEFFKSRKGLAVITLVVDTNVPGHPSVSMKMQPVQLTPDGKPPTRMVFPKRG
jgi:hypothetical protein